MARISNKKNFNVTLNPQNTDIKTKEELKKEMIKKEEALL